MIMAAAKGNGKQGQQTEKWSLFGAKTVEKTANGKKKVVVKVRLAAGVFVSMCASRMMNHLNEA